MVMGITAAMPGTRFVSGSTLLVLDGIQDCPNARSSLKYWDLDSRYDVIATGSFPSVKGFRALYEREYRSVTRSICRCIPCRSGNSS